MVVSMFVTSCQRIVYLSALLILTACATPAHENYSSWLPEIDTRTILVRVYSPDTYEIDGFLDSNGLAQLISEQKKVRGINKILIEPKSGAGLFDQAVAIEIAERNSLRTYRSGLLWTEEVSSKQILEDIDNPISLNLFGLKFD